MVNLFKMIDKFGVTDESKTLLISVAPNLMTIESPTIYQWNQVSSSDAADARFAEINERLLKSD